MSLETDFFRRYQPAFGKLEAAGFRKLDGKAAGGRDIYLYEEDFLDGQFRVQLEVRAAKAGHTSGNDAAADAADDKAESLACGLHGSNGAAGEEAKGGGCEIRGRVIDMDTDEEYLPIRARHQVGGFVGTVRESYLQVLSRIRDICFVPAGFRGEAWIIPSNPKIYDVDAGFRRGGGVIEWHQHNNIRPGDEVFIYSSAPNSAILYRTVVEASDLDYEGMFKGREGYVRAMRIRLIEKYPPDRYPLSFMREHGGSPVRSARRVPAQLLKAMRRKEKGWEEKDGEKNEG